MRNNEATAAIVLTESTPHEVRSLLWAKQCSKDMLANKEDFKYPFKSSSLACPFCADPLTGETAHCDNEEKKKPWELPLAHLIHENDSPSCPAKVLRKLPDGHLIEKIVICHQMTAVALARARDAQELLHEDPIIPKLHTVWTDEDRDQLKDNFKAYFEEKKGRKSLTYTIHSQDEFDVADYNEPWQSLPEKDVQRLFPSVSIPNNQSWEKTLGYLPKWQTEHPSDPNAPKISGWIVQNTSDGVTKTMCGFILPTWEEPLGSENVHPHAYSVPIYRIIGPDSALDKNNLSPIPYLEIDSYACPPEEGAAWTTAITIQDLKKQEKLRKKQKVQEEINQIPKEKIWTGFSQPLLTGHWPEKDRENEPQQCLLGFRSGNDPKKWWLPGIGNPHAPVWIIGLYPSNEEIRRRGGPKILSGPSGTELFRIVQECGLDLKKDVYFDNIIKKYMPPKSKISQEIKMEQTWLMKRQLAFYQPKRIICLGAEVYKEIAGNKSFQNYRGTWTPSFYPRVRKESDPYWEGKAAGTFHPAGVLRPEGRHNLELFRHDLATLLLDKSPADVQPTITEIISLAGVNRWVEAELTLLEELAAKNQKIIYALDTESYSLDAHADELISLQIAKVIIKCPENDPVTLSVVDVPQHCDILLFQENSDPEVYDKETFEHIAHESASNLLQLSFDCLTDPQQKEPAAKPKKPVVALANSHSEKQLILNTHSEKRSSRGLILFTPFKKIMRLKGKEKEVGRLLSLLATHPSVHGYVLTNANHDRIRLEKELGWDLTTPQKNGGLSYPLDTVILEHILNENNELGLKACLNRHFNWPRQDAVLDEYAENNELVKIKGLITDKTRQSEWSLYPWKVLKPYAGKDAFGTAALLQKQLSDLSTQSHEHQNSRILDKNPNTLHQAFHISCGAINGTYEMNKNGMPVGKKGMKVLETLTNFYAKHEKRMVDQYQDAVFKLTGLRNANPASPEELSYVLFSESSTLKKQGIEPWKESGRNGRLWADIPKEERSSCTASTDAESLEIIASNCKNPEIQQFLLRLSETKTILTIRSSFLPDMSSHKGIIGRINKKTLCMHTTYTPTLDTNRCRSLPNLSTFPKEEVAQVEKILGEAPPHRIREIIQAPDGAYLLNRDWTTAEVLGIGYLSQDKNMLEIISRMNRGMDFHCKLAIKTYKKISETFELVQQSSTPPTDWLNTNFSGKQQIEVQNFWAKQWEYGAPTPLPEEELHKIAKKLFKQERSNIKPVTFGVPYGREAPAIMKALNREYYINDTRTSTGELLSITLSEAQAMIDSYKSEFPQAWSYLIEQSENAISSGVLKDHWGYIRHFPQGMKQGDLVRKAYNYQIQHIVAVLMNQAMNDWTQIKKALKLKSYAYATLYDNIGWVVYEEELQKVWDLSMEVMTEHRPVGPSSGPLPILNSWHIPTEGEISLAWDAAPIDPLSLGITLNPQKNLTGLENLMDKL